MDLGHPPITLQNPSKVIMCYRIVKTPPIMLGKVSRTPFTSKLSNAPIITSTSMVRPFCDI